MAERSCSSKFGIALSIFLERSISSREKYPSLSIIITTLISSDMDSDDSSGFWSIKSNIEFEIVD